MAHYGQPVPMQALQMQPQLDPGAWRSSRQEPHCPHPSHPPAHDPQPAGVHGTDLHPGEVAQPLAQGSRGAGLEYQGSPAPCRRVPGHPGESSHRGTLGCPWGHWAHMPSGAQVVGSTRAVAVTEPRAPVGVQR